MNAPSGLASRDLFPGDADWKVRRSTWNASGRRENSVSAVVLRFHDPVANNPDRSALKRAHPVSAYLDSPLEIESLDWG